MHRSNVVIGARTTALNTILLYCFMDWVTSFYALGKKLPRRYASWVYEFPASITTNSISTRLSTYQAPFHTHKQGKNTSESFYLALKIHNAATSIYFILSFLRLLSHRGKMSETTPTLMEGFKVHFTNVFDGFQTYSISFFATQILEEAAWKIRRPIFSHSRYANKWHTRASEIFLIQTNVL